MYIILLVDCKARVIKLWRLLLLALTSSRLASRAVKAARDQVLPISADLGVTHCHTAKKLATLVCSLPYIIWQDMLSDR